MPVVQFRDLPPLIWNNGPEKYRVINEADVWRAAISQSLPLLPACASVLSADEQKRAAYYHHEKDQHRFVLSRGMLRILAGKYLDMPSRDVHIATGHNQKPFIQNGSIAIHYSMAHSGDMILIAFSDRSLGIDIEFIDPGFRYADVLATCFSVAEREHIYDSASPLTVFYRLWTRKESLLKATGKGVDDDMLHVPCINGTYTVSPHHIASGYDWKVSSFEVADNYAGSVAVQESVKNISLYEISG